MAVDWKVVQARAVALLFHVKIRCWFQILNLYLVGVHWYSQSEVQGYEGRVWGYPQEHEGDIKLCQETSKTACTVLAFNVVDQTQLDDVRMEKTARDQTSIMPFVK